MDSSTNFKRHNIYGALNNPYLQQSNGGAIYNICATKNNTYNPNITCNYIFNTKNNMLTTRNFTTSTSTRTQSNNMLPTGKIIPSLEILEDPKLLDSSVIDCGVNSKNITFSNLIYSFGNFITGMFKSSTVEEKPLKIEESMEIHCTPKLTVAATKTTDNSSNFIMDDQSSNNTLTPNTIAGNTTNVVGPIDLSILEIESKNIDIMKPINTTTITMPIKRENNIEEITNCDINNKRDSRSRKRKKYITNPKNPRKQQVDKMTTTKQQCSSFNPNNLYRKTKCLNKNRKNKNRSKLIWNMEDDTSTAATSELSNIECDEDDDNYVFEECSMNILENYSYSTSADSNRDVCFINKFKNILNLATTSNSNDKTHAKTDMCYFYTNESFPCITSPSKVKENYDIKCSPRKRECSECDSEDSFIIFSNDTPKSTPPTSSIISTSLRTAAVVTNSNTNFCDKIKNKFLPKQSSLTVTVSGNCLSKFIRFVDDNSSDDDNSCSGDESDDDCPPEMTSCYEDDEDDDDFVTFGSPPDIDIKNCQYDSDTEISSDSETEGVESQQPDSGFEEKKVTLIIFLSAGVIFHQLQLNQIIINHSPTTKYIVESLRQLKRII